MRWRGQAVPGTTYRHAWGHYGEVVRARSDGDVLAAARALARAAGLRGAWVCPEKNSPSVAFEVVDLPWDLAAVEMAALTHTSPVLARDTLRLECEAPVASLAAIGTGRGGGGSGYGMGGGRAAPATREERLEGTLFFAGLVRLGPDGRAELDVPLPRHPGRWRIESLVIADDAGGARAHAILHTRTGLELSLDAPPWLSPGDETRVGVRVSAPALAGRAVALEASLGAALRATAPVPRSARGITAGLPGAPAAGTAG